MRNLNTPHWEVVHQLHQQLHGHRILQLHCQRHHSHSTNLYLDYLVYKLVHQLLHCRYMLYLNTHHQHRLRRSHLQLHSRRIFLMTSQIDHYRQYCKDLDYLVYKLVHLKSHCRYMLYLK